MISAVFLILLGAPKLIRHNPIMRRINLLTWSLILLSLPVLAQQRKPATKRPVRQNTVSETKSTENAIRKYPSLLWEISGNGLKKPSYLFGTMHVSDKLAFHLGDSFYNAIKSSDVVALETNPETWQQDYSESVFFRRGARSRYYDEISAENYGYLSDLMRITSFAIDDYQEAIKAMLAVEPSMINGMLYRTYGTQMDDFEEDTFLDMYIFQAGKKLGKKLTGVENFQESEKLVMEAYRDMMRDRNKKRKSFDFEGMLGNPKKLEDAYRKGDLDLLDSLESLTVFSDAFQEKFLYKRNEIQANSIDSIIKKSTLFVGVGAAHLPGKRGVIEMLRRMGYTMRPVKMDERSSVQKESIDKLRSKNVFELQTSDDSFYKVAIPGKKFYRFTEWGGMDVVQFADLVNGAYYMVTRVKTNSYSWGHSTDLVHKEIDSLLYENIPGKILKKTAITKNGYKGWEIINRTRRGDYQRYNIFITPFEVISFKISGNGEYISNGDEAQQFFSSIQLKEYPVKEWISFQPKTGGFAVQLPHDPSLLKDQNYGADRLEYAAYDPADGNSYLVMKSNFHNYSFVEEDSFDLNLMEESYSFSPFISKQLSRKFYIQNGYPALEAKYLHEDGSYSSVRYVIRGAMYYAAIARYKKENENSQRFLKSFAMTPFIYPETVLRKDTSIKFTVYSPFFPEEKKKKNELDELEDLYRMSLDDDEDDYDYRDAFGQFKSIIIGNDTLGEKVIVSYYSIPKYSFEKDTTSFWKKTPGSEYDEDSSFIYKVNKRYTLPNGVKCREIELTDTGSSRLIIGKVFYHNGHLFSLTTLTDTSSKRSPFIEKFFKTFTPVDTLKGVSLHVRKSEQFFKDFFSTDSAIAKKARSSIYQVDFDSLDIPLLKNAIERVNWDTKNYLRTKKQFIASLGEIRDSGTVEFLKQLYVKVKDTSELQNSILEALLDQESKPGFKAFKDLILQEPPIVDEDNYDYDRNYRNLRRVSLRYRVEETGYSGMWPQLYDTLSLTKTIFPEFLQLVNVDDYEDGVMNLLTALVDSGYLKASDYENYFSKFYLDAKQLLKKQVAKEEKENIEKAGKKDKTPSYSPVDIIVDQEQMESGNSDLDKSSVLLMPFYEKNQGVRDYFQQLLKTKDRQLLYSTFILMLRNKKPVPDSLFAKYAKLDEYRAKLYTDLKKMKQLDKFPAAYKNQLEIARSIFVSSTDRYDRMDTLVFVDKLPVTYKGKKGYVYFFKYKQMRDDSYWQLASVGMQPANEKEIDIDDDEFTDKQDRKLETGKPTKEQLEKMLKELLNAKHTSASTFYEARSLSVYKNYLSEMVKRGRYRD